MHYPLAPCPTMPPDPRRIADGFAAPSPSPGSLPVHATQALVIVQDARVVCVVESHRHDSAVSVARLLCRLLLSDVHIYTCPLADSGTLNGGDHLPHVPDTWREIFRATSWAEAMPTVIDIR